MTLISIYHTCHSRAITCFRKVITFCVEKLSFYICISITCYRDCITFCGITVELIFTCQILLHSMPIQWLFLLSCGMRDFKLKVTQYYREMVLFRKTVASSVLRVVNMSYVYADVRQQNMLPANEMMAPLALTRRKFSFSQNSQAIIV